MLNNEFYQKAKAIATKFEKAKGDYKEHKVNEVKQNALKEVKSLISQYKGFKESLRVIRQQELKEAKEKLDSMERSSFFEIVNDGKIDFDMLDRQEKLQRYFSGKFSQVNSPRDLEFAVNELVATGDAEALNAFKMAYSQTNLPFLNESDNKYLRSTKRAGLQTENLQMIRAIDDQINKFNIEYTKLTNPDLHEAELKFTEAQTNLQSAMGFGTDDILNGLNDVFNDINGFGGEGINKSSDRFFK